MSPFNEFLLVNRRFSLMCLLILAPFFFLKKFISVEVQLVWLFSLISSSNYLGLAPYTWTITLYPVATFMCALILWRVFSLQRISVPTVSWNARATAHYLPLTTPLFLWLILPVIEVVSQFIRPITLTVRLTANLVAGHVLIFLVRYLGVYGGLIYLILIPFEMIVAVVQGYVFIMLLDSYSQER